MRGETYLGLLLALKVGMGFADQIKIILLQLLLLFTFAATLSPFATHFLGIVYVVIFVILVDNESFSDLQLTVVSRAAIGQPECDRANGSPS